MSEKFKYIEHLPHGRLWCLLNVDFMETKTYYLWASKCFDKGLESRKAARLIERAQKSLYL